MVAGGVFFVLQCFWDFVHARHPIAISHSFFLYLRPFLY
jgi:hypothetical protein